MKVIKTILCLVLALLMVAVLAAAAWVGLFFYHTKPANIIPYPDNGFMTSDTMVVAHRSGGGIVPEETMAAFRYCVESGIGIDIFEFDLHLTADNVPVLLHDAELDRTSDSEEVFGVSGVTAAEKTYEELRQLNMGAKYINEAGETPYAGLTGEDVPDDIRIATLDEVLDYLTASGDFRYIIEIKDAGERGFQAVDLLYETAAQRNLLDKIIFASFHDDIMAYVAETYPDACRGASTSQAVEFYFRALLNDKNYVPTFNTVQPPYGNFKSSYGANYTLARVINYAHERGIAFQYWTINREEDMKYLLRLGVDGITTDYPDRLSALKQGK